jgi:hypothetical protein
MGKFYLGGSKPINLVQTPNQVEDWGTEPGLSFNQVREFRSAEPH